MVSCYQAKEVIFGTLLSHPSQLFRCLGEGLVYTVINDKQQIRDPHTRMLGVSKHIDECATGRTPQFTILPFYKILSPSESMRKNKERFFFILKYK